MKSFRRYEPLTIKEPFRVIVKRFDDPEAFTKYYREHEDEFKNISTLRLNKSYKIPGYRITVKNRGKDDEELMLKKDYYGGTGNVENDSAENTYGCLRTSSETDNSEIVQQLQILEDRIKNIEQFLIQMK